MSADLPAPTWDAVRPVRRHHRWAIAGGITLLPGLVAVVLRVFPPSDDATALLASFIPYGLVVTAVALGCFLLAAAARRSPLALIAAALAVALLALQLSWRVPDFVADGRPTTTRPFTLMSLNLYDGEADPAEVWAYAQQADVVILVEAKPGVLRALAELGLRERFAYALGDADTAVSDTAVFSRFPLTRSTLIRLSFQQWRTDVTVPEIGELTLFAVHPCNPYCGRQRWYDEHITLNQRVADAGDGPIVMAGDFNAIDDHGPMQQLRRQGMRSATDVAGAGWLPTWPANKVIPPMIPIDHVMISPQLTATSVRAFSVAGTDHRGLLTTLAGTS